MTPMSAMHDPVECPVCFEHLSSERPESSFRIATAMIVCALIVAALWFVCIVAAPHVMAWAGGAR